MTHSAWVLAWQSAAGHRARIRDPKWLEQQWSRTILHYKPRAVKPTPGTTRLVSEKEEMRRATWTSRLSAVEAALELHDTGTRCMLTELAERAGLSYWSTRYLLRTVPALREKLRLLSSKCDHSQEIRFERAAQELHAVGVPLSGDSLLREARMGHNSQNRKLAREFLSGMEAIRALPAPRQP
ncbi:hypothetical protein [Paraburkholderia youngii]|uniref:Uncharacterized protein n=1 Tax=Paraburkholderia youngii TaxID=2782701 RepID=A0A7Y6JXH1_9BURK|nr:hypothetical protein [Paraburkholderia youngii]NUX99738.1 hypothetical protein [Paraburkholderia youngii]